MTRVPVSVTVLGALLPLAALPQSSATREQALGKQLAQEVERHSTLVTDPAIAQYADRIGQKLARAANLREPLTVKVITGDNAYALPGASVYIDTSLILTAASEAELAGAIAHLLGHIALWHDSHQVDPLMTAQIPIVWLADCLRLAAGGFAIPMGIVGKQTQLESQADQLGLEYMDRAGYDPGALADLFERMLSQPRKRSVLRPWAKFPESTRTQADALRIQGNNFVVNTSEFAGIQQRVSALQVVDASARTDAPTLKRERMAPVEHDVNVIRDAMIVDYLNRIARKLVASAALTVPLTVKVIQGHDTHAITLPQGISYLPTGLILSATSEAELAGAIAHQLGHIADPQGKAAESQGLCLRGLAADDDAEMQADLKGLEYLNKAGYDPGALADFYQRILNQALPASTRARADELRNGRALVLTTSEFRDVQRRLTALPH
jgi:predicted Zn-dependent protease